MPHHLKGRIRTGTQMSTDNGNNIQTMVLHLQAIGSYHIMFRSHLPLQPQTRFAAICLDAWLKLQDTPQKHFNPGNLQAQEEA